MALIRVQLDTLSPDLARKMAALKDLTPVAVTAAELLRTYAEQAFDEPSMRMTPWAPRKGNATHPLLKKHGQLWRSFVVKPGTSNNATVSSDRPYAAAHQFGTRPYKIRPKNKAALFWPGAKFPVKLVRHPGLPARPFFPVDAQGRVWKQAEEDLLDAVQLRVDALVGLR